MIPAILLRSKDDATASEVERFAFGEIRKRAGEFFGAVPDGTRFTGGSIGNVNCPRVRTNLKKGQALFEAVDADESDLLPVRGPTGHPVAIHRGSEVAEGFTAEIVNGDETVIAAMRNEGDFSAVRRPLWRIIFAADKSELTRGHCAGHRRDPELPASSPNGHGAIGRKLNILAAFARAIQFTQIAWLALVLVHSPDFLVWARNVARWIGNFAGGIEFAAAGINDRAPVGSEPKASESHAVVARVVGNLAGGEGGRVGDPNVANALGVESPCDTRRAGRNGQVVRERRAHDLLDSEALRDRSMRSKQGARCERSESRDRL